MISGRVIFEFSIISKENSLSSELTSIHMILKNSPIGFNAYLIYSYYSSLLQFYNSTNLPSSNYLSKYTYLKYLKISK